MNIDLVLGIALISAGFIALISAILEYFKEK